MEDVEEAEEEGGGVVDEEEHVAALGPGVVEEAEEGRNELQGLLLGVGLGDDLDEGPGVGGRGHGGLGAVEEEGHDEDVRGHEGRRVEDGAHLGVGLVGVGHGVEGALVDRVGEVDGDVPGEQLGPGRQDLARPRQGQGRQEVGGLAAGRGHGGLVQVAEGEAALGVAEELAGGDLDLPWGDGEAEDAGLVEAVDEEVPALVGVELVDADGGGGVPDAVVGVW